MRNTLASLLLLAGCAGEPPCDLEAHTYLEEFKQLSGDCGETPSIIRGPRQAVVPQGCTFVRDLPADGACGLGREQRCVSPDGSQVAMLSVVVHRNDDDETWSGLNEITVSDTRNNLLCSSVYQITLTPQ